jgi:hypothetical protein
MSVTVNFHMKRMIRTDGGYSWEDYQKDVTIESWHTAPGGRLYTVRFDPDNAQLMDEDSIRQFARKKVDLRPVRRGYTI